VFSTINYTLSNNFETLLGEEPFRIARIGGPERLAVGTVGQL